MKLQHDATRLNKNRSLKMNRIVVAIAFFISSAAAWAQTSPQVSLYFEPQQIASGESTYLRLVASPADSCRKSDGSAIALDQFGAANIKYNAVNEKISAQVICTNTYGSTEKSAYLRVDGSSTLDEQIAQATAGQNSSNSTTPDGGFSFSSFWNTSFFDSIIAFFSNLFSSEGASQPATEPSTFAGATPTTYDLTVDRLGAAVYSLPVSAPNGIGGVKPNITAVYNSQSPNGLLGKGGSLSGLSAIKRCAQTFVRDGVNKAISWTAEDRFCIDTQRLMLVAGTQGEAESQYKTEIDNGVVYTAKGGTSGNPDYFEARAQDGAVLVFGGVASAKEQGAATMTWALSQYKDAANNAIEYVYDGSAADGLRIKRINYAFPVANTTANPGAYIDFVYKDREDPIAKFVAGYEFRTSKLLTQINAYTLPGMLHRSYQLDYATSSGLAGYVSRWQGVDECITPTQCFSASQFSWGTTQVNTSGVTELKDINIGWLGDVARHGYTSNNVTRADSADLNGNGIAELLIEEDISYNGASPRMSFAAFDPGVLAIDANNTNLWMAEQKAADKVADVKPLSFADVNADGVLDLITSGYVSSETLSVTAGVQFRNANWWYLNQTSVPNYSSARYNLYGDFDGDGLTYQMLMNRNLKYYSSISDVWLTKVKKNTSVSSDQANYFAWGTGVGARFSDITSTTPVDGVNIPSERYLPSNVDMAVADFNGDGKSDVLLYTSWFVNQTNQTEYKLNWYSWSGSQFALQGNVYSKMQAGNFYDNGYMYDASSLRDLVTPDINGDGLADIGYRVSTTEYQLSKGNGFSGSIQTNHTVATRAHKVWYHDINQDGSADQIFVTQDLVSNVYYYNYHVSYWNALQFKFLDPVVLRTTVNTPINMADANGDGWVDFIEYDQAAKTASKPYVRIYGFTNALSATANNPGVLARDVIVGIKTGIRKFESIEYQTLARPATVKAKTCTSPNIPCQDFYGVNHYESNRIKGTLTGDSLTMSNIDDKSYYRKANEPFAGLVNPYAETARVTQVTNSLPIVIRTKTTVKQSAGDVLSADKKYFYTSLRTQAGGRGLLGFEKTSVEDLLASTKVETSWRQDWPYTGMVAAETTYTKFGKLLAEKTNQLNLTVNGGQNNKVFSPRVEQVTAKTYELKAGGAEQGNLITNVTASAQNSSVKAFDNVTANTSSASAVADIGKPSEYKLNIDRLGAAVYSLPVSAPNGIGGVKPNITAVYNSQSPNGLLGKGGSLSGLSAIKRCAQTFVRDGVNKAISWTAEDRFCIDTQRLMLVAGTQGEAESQYKTEIDNGVVYTAKGGTSGNPDYFEARAQDGAVLVFGGVASAKEQGAAIMTWALSQYKDAANNAIEYVYEGTAADGLRIKRINYAFPVANTTANPGAYIDFVYKDREDPIAKFVAGYEFRTSKLLTQINAYTLPGMLHRSYQLDYATSSGLAGYVSRWQGVDECVTPTQCFSASQFSWGNTQVNASGVTELKDINIGWLSDIPRSGYFANGGSVVRADFADLNGNGIGDLILDEQGYYNSDYSLMTFSHFDPTVLAIDTNNTFAWRADQRATTTASQVKPFSFADINADGVLDLISGGYVSGSETLSVYCNTQFRSTNMWYFRQHGMPNASGTRYNLYADLDGDGLTYQILMGRDLKYASSIKGPWLSKVKKNTATSVEEATYFSWSTTTQASFSDITSTTPVNYVHTPGESGSPGNVDMAVADFNGDGKSDVVTYTSWYSDAVNKTDYNLNWYSWDGAKFNLQGNIYKTTMTGSYYQDGYMYDASGLKELNTPDLNGDGLADISYRLNNSSVDYVLSKGNGFAPSVKINHAIANRAQKVWYHDVNRDGSIDIIFMTSDPVSGVNYYNYHVSYWSTSQSKYLDPVVLRTTTNYPITVADTNGDSWVDFVEFDQPAQSVSGKPYIKVYGFTNSLSATANNQGVLARDVIVGIKTGIRKFESIEYQTLARPATVKAKTCTSPNIPCQDFYGVNHYESNRIKGTLTGDSLTMSNIDDKSYYRKANEPFAGLVNPYAETARVTQVTNSLPIVIRTKTTVKQSTGDVLSADKKYFYTSLRTQAGGRGLLGFEKTSVEDLLASTKVETSWRQDWPYTGMVARLEEKDLQGATLREADNQFTLNVANGLNGVKIFTPATQGQLVKNYAAPTVAGETGRLLSTHLISTKTSSATSSSTRSSSSARSVSSSSSVIAEPVSLELTAPGEGAVLNYELGNSVALSAVVKAADGSVWKDTDGLPPKVVFYHFWGAHDDDQTRLYQRLAEGAADGLSVNWTPDAQGIYAIRAMAYLNNGKILYSKFAGIWVNRPAGFPVAGLTATSYGSTYAADYTLRLYAEANDEDGIESIGFYANDNFIGNAVISGTNAPQLDWKPTAVGSYWVYALVKDRTGKVSKTKTTLINYGVPSAANKIVPPPIDRYPYLTKPLSYPVYYYPLGSDVLLASQLRGATNAQWTETDNSIPKAKFYAADIYAAESVASGFYTTWRPSLAAAYEMTAISRLQSNELIVSPPATLLVAQPTAPRALLTSPSYSGRSLYQGQLIPISVTANAMTGSSISRVIFYANDEEIGVDTTAPYSLSWAPPSTGLYKVKAHVIDSKGVIGVSAQREVRYVSQGATNSIVTINEPALTALNAANDQYFDGLSSSYRLRIATQQLPANPVVEIFAKSNLMSSWSYSPWVSVEPGNSATFAGPVEASIQSNTAGIILLSVSGQAIANYDYRARVCDQLSFNCSEFSTLASITLPGANSSSSNSSSAVSVQSSLPSSQQVLSSSSSSVAVAQSSLVNVSSAVATSQSSSSVAASVAATLIAYPLNESTVENFANAPCFQWNAIAGAGSYQITLGTTSGLASGSRWTKSLTARAVCWGNGVAWNSLHESNAIPENLLEGTTYYWQVSTTVNGALKTSAVQSFVLAPRGLPAVPQITNAPIQSISSFSLEWSPTGSVAVDYYNLKEKSNGQINFYSNLTTRSYILTPLNAMVYEYSLQACNTKGCSDFSAPVRVMANPLANLASPALVAPADNTIINVSSSNPCFQWNTVSGATSYSVAINTDGHFPISRWQKATTSTSLCWDGSSGWLTGGLQKPTDFVMKEGATYYWRVTAVKGGNEAYGFSQTRSFRMSSGSVVAPATPPAITVEPSSSSFSINWRSVTGASYYELQKASSGDLFGSYGAEWSASAIHYSTNTLVSGLLDYNIYRWRVRACNTSKLCSDWQVSELKVYQPTTSLAPVSLVLPANAANLGGNPCFEWTPNPLATSHIVTISVGNYFPAQRWAKSVTTGNRICWNGGEGWESAGINKIPVPVNLPQGVPYQWRVVANDNVGGQSRSETRSFVIDTNSSVSTYLPTPSLSVIDADQDCFYIINFGAPQDVPANYVYELYEKKSGATQWQQLVSRSRARGNIPPFTLYSDADIFNNRHLQGGAYDFRARICEEGTDNCGAYSSSLPVNTSTSCSSVVMPMVKFNPAVTTATVNQETQLTASATTTQGSITSVKFYAGGELIGTATSAPYSVVWKPTKAGSIHIEAIAETSNGGTGSSHYQMVTVVDGTDSSQSSSSAAMQPKTIKYTYDALGRLTFVEDSENGNRDYDYDAAGNRTNVETGVTSDE